MSIIVSVFVGASNVTLDSVINGDIDQLFILFVSRIPRLLSILVAGGWNSILV
ncbi:MAG: hypothetical protein ACLRQX_02750 [Turicibacter sanguinis]